MSFASDHGGYNPKLHPFIECRVNPFHMNIRTVPPLLPMNNLPLSCGNYQISDLKNPVGPHLFVSLF